MCTFTFTITHSFSTSFPLHIPIFVLFIITQDCNMYQKILNTQNMYSNDIKCISVANNAQSGNEVPHRTSAVQQ